ncbi:MAG: RNA polymerase sigma-70 factor [Bacteroidota bacterium]
MSSLTRTEIVQRLRNGDRGAFEALFREHYAVMVRFARKFISDPAEAEEVVQDLFVQLWEKRNQLKLNTSIRSYLFTAVRNRCLNAIKHQKVRDQHAEAVRNATPRREADASESLEAAELQVRIQGAIEKLPTRCREVFVLSRFEGKKYQEIAEQLAISPRTVETQIGKALKLLRRDLADYLPALMYLIMWEAGQ